MADGRQSEVDEKAMEAAIVSASKKFEPRGTKLDALGKQEGELFQNQQKLIRGELEEITKELAQLQFMVEELRRAHYAFVALMKKRTPLHDQVDDEIKERKSMDDFFKKEIQQLRTDMKEEARLRETSDKKMMDEIMARLTEHEKDIHQLKGKDVPSINDQLAGLKSGLERVHPIIESVRDSVKQESRTRELGHENLGKKIDNHREVLGADIQSAKDALDPHRVELDKLNEALKKEREDRDLALHPVHEKLSGLHKDTQAHRDELPKIRGLVQDHHDKLHPRQDELQKNLDKHGEHHKTTIAQIMKKLSELDGKIEVETTQRNAFMDEVEVGLSSNRSKLRTLAAEQADNLKKTADDLESTLLEKLEDNSNTHTQVENDIKKELGKCKDGHDGRLGLMEKSNEDLDRRLAKSEAEPRDLGPPQIHTDQINVLNKNMRDVQVRLPKPQETIIYPHEDTIAFLEDSLQDFCERFLSGAERRKDSLPGRPMVMQGAVGE